MWWMRCSGRAALLLCCQPLHRKHFRPQTSPSESCEGCRTAVVCAPARRRPGWRVAGPARAARGPHGEQPRCGNLHRGVVTRCTADGARRPGSRAWTGDGWFGRRAVDGLFVGARCPPGRRASAGRRERLARAVARTGAPTPAATETGSRQPSEGSRLTTTAETSVNMVGRVSGPVRRAVGEVATAMRDELSDPLTPVLATGSAAVSARLPREGCRRNGIR
jgi:hypothetical protein